MCGIGWLICTGRGGNFRLEIKLLEEDGGKILDPRKIRFRGSHGIGFKKIALL